MTKAEKRKRASEQMASGKNKLPLPLFEAIHPEEVLTDSTERISELGLKYRSGKHLQFKDTVNNFLETFESLCEGIPIEECIEEQIVPDFANYCLFGKKPCVKDQAIKKLREKNLSYQDEDPFKDAPESYWKELNELEAEEIPF